jgi:hypothetical protein
VLVSTVPRELLSVPIRDVLVLYLIEKIIIVVAQCAVIHLHGGIGICLTASWHELQVSVIV